MNANPKICVQLHEHLPLMLLLPQTKTADYTHT